MIWRESYFNVVTLHSSEPDTRYQVVVWSNSRIDLWLQNTSGVVQINVNAPLMNCYRLSEELLSLLILSFS